MVQKANADSDDAVHMKHTIVATALTVLTLFSGALPIFASTDLKDMADGQVDGHVYEEVTLLSISDHKESSSLKISSFYQFPVQSTDYKGISQYFSRRHPGYDIRAKYGAQIYPIRKGVISHVGYEGGGYGKYLVIDHENGIRSLYAHLKNSEVKKGDVATEETVLGSVGLTGRTTGPHIHFEIQTDSAFIDPGSILPTIDARGLELTASAR